ncbi:Mercuric resistance operon regulatory protein [Thiomonas sp. CB3]|nr:Mercuric resistance operon regulatory protein [Thiomonas sp. CB3]
MLRQPIHMTIGTVAKAVGVNVETIRFYQRKGLLGEPMRPQGSFRRYGPGDVARLQFIKSAQRLGFSLDEIAGLLQLDDGVHCDQARELGERRLQDVRIKLADLKRIESVLAAMIRACGSSDGSMSCPLIEALHGKVHDT